MIGKYKPYPSYKESGNKWLGNIPLEWEMLGGKRLFDQRRQAAAEDDQQLAASQAYGVVPQSWLMDQSNQRVVQALKGTESFRHVGVDDFVISLRSFEGGIEHSAYEGCVSPAYTVLAARKTIIPKYYKYLLKSAPLIRALQASTDSLRDGKSISFEQFGQLKLPLPRKSEQTQIAAFLDHETAKIDRLIAKQEELIALLKEKRQAVISHAVTKGLDPDVPMKDSGVEWLGEIPAHWGRGRLKRKWSVLDCKHVTAEFCDEGLPLASITEVQSHYVDLSKAKLTNIKYYLHLIEGGRKPIPGDIIYSRNATVGKASIVKDNQIFAMGQDVCLLRSTKCDAEYFYCVLTSKSILEQLEILMVGATFKRINVENIKNFYVPFPPFEEQVAISSYLKTFLSG